MSYMKNPNLKKCLLSFFDECIMQKQTIANSGVPF